MKTDIELNSYLIWLSKMVKTWHEIQSATTTVLRSSFCSLEVSGFIFDQHIGEWSIVSVYPVKLYVHRLPDRLSYVASTSY